MDISKQNLADHNQKIVSIKMHNIYAGYAFVLTAAACFAGSIGSRLLMLGITGLFALLIFKPVYLLGPIMFFTIFDDFLLVASNASASRFLTIFFILGAAGSILKRGSIKQSSLYFILLMCLGVLLSFYSIMGYTAFPISYILNITLAVMMINISVNSGEKITKQINYYAMLAVVYVYFLLWQNGFDSLVDGSRMTIAENVNSNELARGLAITMTLLVCNLLVYKNNVLISILLIGANLIALFLTGSRTALIASIATAFLLYLINTQDKHSRRKAIILVAVSTILLIFI